MKAKRIILLLPLALHSALAAGAGSESVVAKLKNSGYLCKDTPDGAGYACTGESPSVYITVPKGVEQFGRSVFYAHGLVNVCRNPGASGENYLRGQAGALKNMKAISVMPYRHQAQNAAFPLSAFIQRMDALLGSKDLPWDLAGHSAAGPFFANELNGNGAEILPRVQNVLLLDAIYGDQRERWNRVLKRQPKLKLNIVATTTAEKARQLESALKTKFTDNVSLKVSTERHCDVPEKFFPELAKGFAKPAAAQAMKNCPACVWQK